MSPKHISYLAFVCLLLIFAAQALLVIDYFRTTRSGLIRESDAILEEAFRSDLNKRHKQFQIDIGEDTIVTPPPPPKNNPNFYDCSNMSNYANNTLGLIDLVINTQVSTIQPINLVKLDSITNKVLLDRNIHTNFVLNIIDKNTGSILQQSKIKLIPSLFDIQSKLLNIDINNKKSLQLILINPFSLILKRMGVMLASSLLLSIICFVLFRYLQHVLSRQKQLIDVKNNFFGNTAHELKRPVAHLHLALEALSNPAMDVNKEKKERYLAISRDAVNDMIHKINMIQTLSMAEEGIFRLNYSEFNLSEIMAEYKEKFEAISKKRVAITIENPTELILIHADKEHIRQCIANLIDNAIKYSNESVEIDTTMLKTKGFLEIHVRDNGIGIEPDKLNSVFEKYTRLHTGGNTPDGFGIGLSYVKTVIEKHKGRIEVKSEPGTGSEFIISLPL